MSQDPLEIAKQAERDLNTQEAKGNTKSTNDASADSGVNTSVETKFPGARVQIGGQGAGDNREIPVEEGGGIDKVTGRPTKAKDFEGPGGPEDKAALDAANFGGDNDIRENIRQGGETRRP